MVPFMTAFVPKIAFQWSNRDIDCGTVRNQSSSPSFHTEKTEQDEFFFEHKVI